MVSFDAKSLFTYILLNECIDLVVKYISGGNLDIKLSTAEQRGKYLPLFTDTEINNCFSTYQTSG